MVERTPALTQIERLLDAYQFGYGESTKYPAPPFNFRLDNILDANVDIDAAVEDYRTSIMFHMPSKWREHFYSLRRALHRDLKPHLDGQGGYYNLPRSTFAPASGIKLFDSKVSNDFKLATYQTFLHNYHAATGGALEGANLNNVLISGLLVASCLNAEEGIDPAVEDQVIEIYLVRMDDEEARRKVKHIRKVLARNIPAFDARYRTVQTATDIMFCPVGVEPPMHTAQLKIRIQRTLSDEASGVLRSSSLAITDVIWDGKDVYLSAAALRAISAMFEQLNTSKLRTDIPVQDLALAIGRCTTGRWTESFINLIHLEVLWGATGGDAAREQAMASIVGEWSQMKLRKRSEEYPEYDILAHQRTILIALVDLGFIKHPSSEGRFNAKAKGMRTGVKFPASIGRCWNVKVEMHVIIPAGLRDRIEGYVDFAENTRSRRLQDRSGELFELHIWTVPSSDTWNPLPTHLDYPAFSIMAKATLLTQYLIRRTSPTISFKDVEYAKAFCNVMEEEVEPLFGQWPTLDKWLHGSDEQ
ncbi:hypothetical protein OC844_005797 [Tilletia horrida]|nr:hypothetical protein OC844_005797 [Tilletia horrida]